MIDDTDSLRALEGAIERLSPDARASLEHWIYLNLSRPEEVLADRVVESAARYESPFLSFEEYLQREAVSPIRHEYVDGEVFAMSAPTLRHGVICGNTFNAVFNHLRGRPCRAFMENVKVAQQKQQPQFSYYPDVLVACGKLDQEAHHLEEPKLVVEVLSPSTARTDRNEKSLNYRLIPTLDEYVIIAQRRREVTLLRRREEWKPLVLISSDAVLDLESVQLALPLEQIYEGAVLDGR